MAFLEKLTVHEVSPVMLGAGIGTHTTAIKSAKEADEGTSEEDAGQGGEGGDPETVAPSGPPPEVVQTEIEILALEG